MGEADVVGPQDGGSEDGVDTQSSSRYMTKEEVSRLLEDARHRCCVCRVLIDPQRFDSEAQFGSLEKHHIIYFSEGGGNTCDKLPPLRWELTRHPWEPEMVRIPATQMSNKNRS